MSPTEPWIEAWLNGSAMPPNSFPESLRHPLLDVADLWMTSNRGPRKQLEEFVTREESYRIMDGLLYAGFCRDRTQPQRIMPIPVITQIVYGRPPPADREALVSVMTEIFGRVLSEWC